jgi:hypothetical protein
MERRNPRVFIRFWTLSIAMGVYTPYLDLPHSASTQNRINWVLVSFASDRWWRPSQSNDTSTINCALLPLLLAGSILKVIHP